MERFAIAFHTPVAPHRPTPFLAYFINGRHIIEVALQFIIGYSSPVDAVTRLMPCGSNCYLVMSECSTEALSFALGNVVAYTG